MLKGEKTSECARTAIAAVTLTKHRRDAPAACAAFHFVVVVKNTGSTAAPAGTQTTIEARQNGSVVIASTVQENALNPGQTAYHAFSVDCPNANYQLSIHVTTDAARAVPGGSHTAALDVRTTR